MLSRWLYSRLKAAENALNDGRIDEAYQRLCQPDVHDHRRANKLLDELAKALLARARLHAQAGHYRDTLDDLDKLETLQRSSPDAATLRKRAVEALRRKRGDQAERNEAYGRAAEDLRAGRLESGRLAIDRVADSRRRDQLRDELDIRLARSEQLLGQAQAALEQGDVLTACRYWEEAHSRHGRSRESDALAARLVPAFRDTLETLFDEGHLDRLASTLNLVEQLRTFDPALKEHERLVSLCSRATAQLADGRYADLRDTLLRLRAARGKVAWVNEALEASAAIEQAHDRLLSSPLGLFSSAVEKSGGIVEAGLPPAAHDRVVDGVAVSPAQDAAGLRNAALLMLVDGTGSVLLVTRDVVRIGRAGGEAAVEIPVPADIQSHHADIIRDGEDYFLAAYGPASVNRKEVKRTLLRDGDRIVFGPKAKMVFRKPTAKSESAVLNLSDRCRLPQDVSHVVLFKDTALLGPQASCHIRTREGQTRLVLFERAGYLYARQTGSGGRPIGPAEPVRLGATCEYGDQRVTVKRYEVRDSGRLA